MKKLLFLLGLVVSMTAIAAPPADGPRKEAVLEGKYLRILASAPDFANEGTDSLNNKGVGKGMAYGVTEWFVQFAAPLAEERTGAMYSVRLSESANGKPVPDAKWHAEYLIKTEGLDPAKATQIQAPSVPWSDAKVVALRAEGVAFDNPKTGKEVVYAIGVSFPDGKAAYAMSGKVLTPIAAFDADPEKVDKRSRNVLGNFWKNSKVERK